LNVHPHPLGSDRSSSSRRAPAAGLLEEFCLARLSSKFRAVPVRLELWDGTVRSLSELPPIATIRIHDRGALLGLATRPDLGFGEAYADGRLDVRGDLVALFEAVNRKMAGQRPPLLWRRFLRGTTNGSARSSRHNVHRHYDLGNDFYRLWLDTEMVYTCAYFESAHMDLEEAQRAKLDYVCRKLRLRRGDRVIEAGCGWGALALHMAREYGATVRAYNISTSQLEHARERAAREGLSGQVTFVDDDYRSIRGTCDAFVSIGMLEHVGSQHYPELGRVIDRVLDPERGRGLLHFIGRNVPAPFNGWTEQHIFPGAYAPVLSEVLENVLEPMGFSVIDVENLRLHYARTLEHWRTRFEQCAPRVRAMFDEAFVRTWRLYLATAEAGFTSGELQLFQLTFGRAADNSRPWTRRQWYADQVDAVV
jgi:cyclopropane-fatty-acyl-phospholipid synthase